MILQEIHCINVGIGPQTNIAPINEVLAVVLLLSGWDGQGDFLDPMCGSGTHSWLKQL
jgi:hypothetical protein